MKNLIKIFIFLSLIFFGILYPQKSFSQELKICNEGVNKCAPLIKDAAKYSKCMKLMCYKYYSPEARKDKDDSKYFFEYVETQEANISKRPVNKPGEEMARSCEYGIRKCDSLSSNPEYYWECITDSCKHQPPTVKADCQDGRNQCLDQQRVYNDCMKLTCGNQAATFENCPEAKYSCGESFKQYWRCVYKICLGPVDQYIKPASTKKFMVIRDNKGIKRRIIIDREEPIVSSSPSWAANAPKGIDPEEWIRSQPQKFSIMGNPSDYMQCVIPSALIQCSQDDVRSCRCSDGSIPLMLNGVPSPQWNKN